MSRDLNKLKPGFLKILKEAIEAAELRGVSMVPYETERDVWKQARLWRKSRTGSEIRARLKVLRESGASYLAEQIEYVGPQKGKWATNAIPGLSWHQWGLACDLYWDSNGLNEPGGAEWNDLTGYKTFAEICKNMGLTSGFFWRSRDAVHVQMPEDHRPMQKLSYISDQMKERYGYRS